MENKKVRYWKMTAVYENARLVRLGKAEKCYGDSIPETLVEEDGDTVFLTRYFAKIDKIRKKGNFPNILDKFIRLRSLTATKVGWTDKAVQYCITFWVNDTPVPGGEKEFYINKWFPKRVVTVVDGEHILVPKTFLDETLATIKQKHPFTQVRYNAQYYPDRFKWTQEAISNNS